MFRNTKFGGRLMYTMYGNVKHVRTNWIFKLFKRMPKGLYTKFRHLTKQNKQTKKEQNVNKQNKNKKAGFCFFFLI